MYKIQEKIIKLSKKSKAIEIMWIPSHRGIDGNEIADSLAREAVNSNSIPIQNISLSWTTVIPSINHYFQEKWETEWQNTIPTKTTKRFFPKIDSAIVLKKLCHIAQPCTSLVWPLNAQHFSLSDHRNRQPGMQVWYGRRNHWTLLVPLPTLPQPSCRTQKRMQKQSMATAAEITNKQPQKPENNTKLYSQNKTFKFFLWGYWCVNCTKCNTHE